MSGVEGDRLLMYMDFLRAVKGKAIRWRSWDEGNYFIPDGNIAPHGTVTDDAFTGQFHSGYTGNDEGTRSTYYIAHGLAYDGWMVCDGIDLSLPEPLHDYKKIFMEVLSNSPQEVSSD